ncbi:class I SAM-dependent methyltransferase [Actinomycetospora endophytica]|uniref:Class I SAM-dependent methyltransferase n=1 Tax=Actinomycetospora endophytica TaxID=2291215 RepID=A0ABS8P0T4_9PSEU|nr:class I SAM-dependent methyltransferase [Actinomycetospora endophytica]MCD2191853.1 class I SAM-dependent methyltransferase [Actinomycetospora endophytica]
MIADVGCGTGLYARELCEQVRPDRRVLCVDPVSGMLDRLPAVPGQQPLSAAAEDLADGRVPVPGGSALDALDALDAIVIKEPIQVL